LIVRGNNESNSDYVKACARLGVKVHPARFPAALPEFFIKLLSKEGGIVLDPFAGSNTTGGVAEHLVRRWISIDIEPAYVKASAVRFGLDPLQLVDACNDSDLRGRALRRCSEQCRQNFPNVPI
jgi:site-specific DNA-methyltransferase (cytosine-N4-specific)